MVETSEIVQLCRTAHSCAKCAKYCGTGTYGSLEAVVQMLVVQIMWALVQPAVSSVPAGGDLGDPEYKVARQRSSSLSSA